MKKIISKFIDFNKKDGIVFFKEIPQKHQVYLLILIANILIPFGLYDSNVIPPPEDNDKLTYEHGIMVDDWLPKKSRQHDSLFFMNKSGELTQFFCKASRNAYSKCSHIFNISGNEKKEEVTVGWVEYEKTGKIAYSLSTNKNEWNVSETKNFYLNEQRKINELNAMSIKWGSCSFFIVLVYLSILLVRKKYVA